MPPSSLRDTILRTAVEHVAEHGPDSLSFRKLAADAGVSHQAPYHHFEDRRGVFQAIALEGFSMLGEALRAAQRSATQDVATALLEAYVGFALDNQGHFRVMFRRDLCEMENAPDLKLVADATFDVLVDHVRAELGPCASIKDIRARTTAMWSLAHGLATLVIEGPLEEKVGTITNRRAFIRSVALQSGLGVTLIDGQSKE